MPEAKRTKVLLIGWDAADWKIINPLLKADKMPNLQKLMQNGSSGTIQTLDPPLSPMLWTSIATGKTADKHGILGFIEPDPQTGEPRPAAVTSRNCKAIWNILSQNDLRSNVINWWPSHPAEPILGNYVSNMFTKPEKGRDLMFGTVHGMKGEELQELRIYPEDISLSELLPFVPKALSVDQNKDKHLHNLAALLANCNSVQNVAKHLVKQTNWNFTAVYFETIDQMSHTFMKFYPPQINGVPDEYFDLYKEVVPQMYIHQDKQLGELVELCDDETNIILLSDHGFYSDHLRPLRLPNDPASPSLEHSQFGVLCMNGPAFKKNEEIKGATLLDITPTLLNVFGLAIAEDLDGETVNALQNLNSKRIKSWENVPGNSGMHDQDKLDNSWQSTAAMFQMMELGYIDKLNSDKEKSLKRIVAESNYYLARVLMSKGEYKKALPLLEELYRENPTIFRYAMRLLACLQHLWDSERADPLLEEIKKKFPREGDVLVLAEAIMRSWSGDWTVALPMFKKLEERIQHVPVLYVMLGNEFVASGDRDTARKYYEKALRMDDECLEALKGVSRLEGRNSDKEAILYNTFDGINDLDLNPDRSIDFRKYQLIIRLFLEQFHKGVKKIN